MLPTRNLLAWIVAVWIGVGSPAYARAWVESSVEDVTMEVSKAGSIRIQCRVQVYGGRLRRFSNPLESPVVGAAQAHLILPTGREVALTVNKNHAIFPQPLRKGTHLIEFRLATKERLERVVLRGFRQVVDSVKVKIEKNTQKERFDVMGDESTSSLERPEEVVFERHSLPPFTSLRFIRAKQISTLEKPVSKRESASVLQRSVAASVYVPRLHTDRMSSAFLKTLPIVWIFLLAFMRMLLLSNETLFYRVARSISFTLAVVAIIMGDFWLSIGGVVVLATSLIGAQFRDAPQLEKLILVGGFCGLLVLLAFAPNQLYLFGLCALICFGDMASAQRRSKRRFSLRA